MKKAPSKRGCLSFILNCIFWITLNGFNFTSGQVTGNTPGTRIIRISAVWATVFVVGPTNDIQMIAGIATFWFGCTISQHNVSMNKCSVTAVFSPILAASLRFTKLITAPSKPNQAIREVTTAFMNRIVSFITTPNSIAVTADFTRIKGICGTRTNRC